MSNSLTTDHEVYLKGIAFGELDTNEGLKPALPGVLKQVKVHEMQGIATLAIDESGMVRAIVMRGGIAKGKEGE